MITQKKKVPFSEYSLPAAIIVFTILLLTSFNNEARGIRTRPTGSEKPPTIAAMHARIVNTARNPNSDLAQRLRNQRINLNDTNLLIKAVEDGNAPLVKAFLDTGVDVNAVSGHAGYTPLMLASNMGHKQLIPILLRAGADPNIGKDYQTPLEALANQPGSEETIKLLLRAGANTKGSLHSAASGSIARLLIEAGADVNSIDRISGMPALLYVSGRKTNPKETIEIANELIKAGAEVNTIDKNGHSILMNAAQWGHEDMVKFLLRAGAKPPTDIQIKTLKKNMYDFRKAKLDYGIQRIKNNEHLYHEYLFENAMPYAVILDRKNYPDDMIISILSRLYGEEIEIPEIAKKIENTLHKLRIKRATKLRSSLKSK